MLVYLPMFTNSIADHMRVVKHLAPAGYLQARAFNLGGGTIPGLLVGPRPCGQPRFVRDSDLSEANRAFAVSISR